MSILFVLLMFLLVMSISYFRARGEVPATQPEVWAGPPTPRLQREYGFSIPEGYCFHPGHTWVLREAPETARVGLDSFASNLVGKIDRIEVMGLNRWVRQGQKLMTVFSGGQSLNLLSPVEGVVTAINHDVVTDPSLITQDPYRNGWIAMVKSPDLATNQKNLFVLPAGVVSSPPPELSCPMRDLLPPQWRGPPRGPRSADVRPPVRR